MSLKCPACDQALHIAAYEGVKVALCESCRGVFLSLKSLRHIERTREVAVPVEAATGTSEPDAPEQRRTCPKCRLAMRKVRYGELSPTVIDLCQKCRGLWLDPGELERIQVYYEAANEDFSQQPTLSPSTPSTPSAPFACPKCGATREEGPECADCGIVFAKYAAARQAEGQRETRHANNTTRVDSDLAQIHGFSVRQQHHVTEALFSFERANQYELLPRPTSAAGGSWRIDEVNASGLSILGRNLFGLLYTSTMELSDHARQLVLTIKRRPSLYFHAADLYDENGLRIGRVRRRFSYLNRVVSVTDEDGRERFRVIGPIWRPWTFTLRKGRREVGGITKKWSGVLRESFTDADNFSLRFKPPLGPRDKRLSIGAMMLIDALYFEGRKRFSQHFFSAPGMQLAVVALVLGLYWFGALRP